MENTVANFLLPGFSYFYKSNRGKLRMNIEFHRYMNANPHKFYNCRVANLYDSFQGMRWEGGRVFRNTERPPISINDCRDIVEWINSEGIGVRLVCTNLLLQERDLCDIYSNDILDIVAANNKNSIIVSSELLFDYIKNKYPDLTVGKSTTLCVKNTDEINNALNTCDFFTPDFKLNNNYDDLSKILYPEKIELLINESCYPDCPVRLNHYQSTSATILNHGLGLDTSQDEKFPCMFKQYKYNYFGKNIFNHPSCIKPEDLYTKYLEMGFNNFKIGGRCESDTYALLLYMYFMVKEEYRMDVFADMLWILEYFQIRIYN